MREALLPVLLGASLAGACGPPGLRPTASADPTVACPGQWTSWSLEILDRRANREGSEKLAATLRDAIMKSFPGCSWSGPDGGDRPSVSIEIHRFAAPFEDYVWSAAAEWTVWVKDPAGVTLSEFEALAEVDRPNYYGSNNEKEALQQVFEEALRRTAAGLRAVPAGGPASSPGDTRPKSSSSNSLKGKENL
ncbi:MAG: hypothetical protein ACRD3M_18960 [Thermoanaerobaculia bacterium]